MVIVCTRLQELVSCLQKQQEPFYRHYGGQTVLAVTPVKQWRISLEQRFTVRMP